MWKFRAAALLSSLIFAAVLIEIGLRVLAPATAFLSPSDDAYWLAGEFDELGDDSSIAVDSELGWRMRPGYRAPGVSHDSRGLRHTPPARPGASRRIVLLGDSFTYGLGVRDDETIGAWLAEALPDHAVVNAGTNGYGVGQARLLWESELAGDGADVVVLGYFVDDFNRNTLRIREHPKPRHEISGSELVVTGSPVPSVETLRSELGGPSIRLFTVARFVGDHARRRLGAEPRGFRERARLSERLLGALASSVSEQGGMLIVSALPHCGVMNEDYVRIVEEIAASCERLGIPVVRFAEVFSEHPAPETLCNEHWHLSPAGNRLVADALLRAIGELPPPS